MYLSGCSEDLWHRGPLWVGRASCWRSFSWGRRRGQKLPDEPLRDWPLRLAVVSTPSVWSSSTATWRSPAGWSPCRSGTRQARSASRACARPSTAGRTAACSPSLWTTCRASRTWAAGRRSSCITQTYETRALPLCGAGKQSGQGGAGGRRGGGPGLVWGKRLLSILRDQRQGRHERGGCFRGCCPGSPGQRGSHRPHPAEQLHRSPRKS